MRVLAVFLLALSFALPALAQSGDGGRVERLIERQLSGDGRIVELTGFRGALSTTAQFDRMTISDDEGIWLEITDAVLDWNFSALVRGTLEVTELSAGRIDVARPPVPPETDLPEPAASGFRIPDLPVRIQIAQIAVPEIVLGEPVVGAAMTLTLDGRAALAGGGLDVAINAARTDGQEGVFDINAAFDPGAETLALAIAIDEAPGGLAARVIGLPGNPAVSLSVDGAGPLDDYRADIRLATDGEDRVNGAVTLAADGSGGRDFTADIDGDLRPLLDVTAGEFFGAETRIAARGRQESDGALTLDNLEIAAAQISLSGTGALDAEGQPARLALSGGLENPDGMVVLPGGSVSLAGAQLTLDYDAEIGPDWTFDVTARDVATEGVGIGTARFAGTGVIGADDQTPFSGTLSLTAAELALDDPDLSTALGRNVELQADVAVATGGRVTMENLRLDTAHATLEGRAEATPTDGRLALRSATAARVPDIPALGPVVGPVAAGALDADLEVDAELPGGAIRVSLTGQSRGLDIGVEQLAPLLEPETALDIALVRDEAGTRIETLRLDNPELTAEGSGSVDATALDFALQAALRDIAALEPRLQGPVTADIGVSGDPSAGAIDADFALETDFATYAGVVNLADGTVRLDSALAAERLADFQGIVPVLQDGSLTADIDGLIDLARSDILMELEAVSADVDIGQPVLAPLISPRTRLAVELRQRDGQTEITLQDLSNPQIGAEGRAVLAGESIDFDLAAELADLSLFEPRLTTSARLTATGTAEPATQAVDADLTLATRFADLDGNVTTRSDGDALTLAFLANLVSDNLGTLNAFAPPLRAGRAALRLDGDVILPSGTAEVSLGGTVAGLDIGQPALAGILSPETTLAARLTREGEVIALDGVRISNPALTATGSARLGEGDNRARLDAVLADLGALVPQVPGRLTLSADATDLLGSPNIDARLASATGAELTASGEVGLPGGAVDLRARGTAPLGLAQPFIGNRVISGNAAIDLRVAGQPAPAAVTGQITTTDARLSDPALGLIVSPVNARINLAGGRADIDVTAGVNEGEARAAGTVTLAAPFPVDLGVRLDRIRLRFEDIVQTRLAGALTLTGTSNRLAIGGNLAISGTEVRVPDSGLGGAGSVPLIQHVNAPPGVRQTIERARLPQGEPAPETNGGIQIPLDIRLDATNPIFVRGRGLDAEFAGQLRVTGTASNPVPVGQFDLRRGRLDFLGRRLNLSEGAIRASGGLVPELNIVAEAQTQDITAQIILDGPADAPELTLQSDPDLPEDEILAQILFGRSAANLSPLQVARLISSLARLAGGGSFVEDTRGRFGFADLDLRTDAATGETELAIGQYVNDNLYTEVEVGAGGTAQINLNLDLTDSTRLRSSLGSEGDTGIGIFWQRDY